MRNEEIVLRLTKTADAIPEKQWVPTYYFAICRATDGKELGKIDLRIGSNEKLFFGGNIGYEVYPAFWGNHYAGKACLLLFDLARKHGMDSLYITCNPDNYASRKTCEYAGAQLTCIVDLPLDSDMYLEGERQKCIYRVWLSPKKTVYGKLVRDNIPDLIRADGRVPVSRVLPAGLYEIHLKEKLLEEVYEYLASGETEELCDITEVINALLKASGVTKEQAEALRRAKAERNGAFDRRLFLEEIREGEK